MTKPKANPKRKRRTKKQIEADAHRRWVREIIREQAEYRARETARHMEDLAEYLEGQGAQIGPGLEQARRTTTQRQRQRQRR